MTREERLFETLYDLECAYLEGHISIDTYINELKKLDMKKARENELESKRKKQNR